MTFKKIAIYIFIALLIISSCSCSFNSKPSDISTGTKNNAYKQLSMYYCEGQKDIEQSVYLFEIQNPGIRIEAKPIGNDSFNEFRSNLVTELYAGEGPDIILFDNGYFNSLYKSVISGAFYDLNKLIKNDTEFDLSDYYTDVFECGFFEGKRYFVPLRTDVMLFETIKSALDKNNIKIDYQNWTWKDLEEIADKFGSNKTKSSEYLFSTWFNFSDMLDSFGKSFIDMSKKKSYFNCPELKESLKIYKKLSLFAVPYSDSTIINDPVEGFKSNYYVTFINGIALNGYSLINRNNTFQKDLGEEIMYIPFPSWYGNGYIHGNPYYLMGINSHCKNKEAAFKYIKFLLSTDMQGIKSIKNTHFLFNLGCPVNKKAFSSDLDFMKSDEVKDLFLQNFIPLSNDQISRFAYIVNHIGKPINYDKQVEAIINKASRDYLTEKKTEDQVLSEIDNKVELFLNE